MAKIGRNDPCPCGSGKKHKRCCLPPGRTLSAPVLWIDPDPLDELTNAVIDRIREGRLEEAERLCERLAEEYSDMIDPLDRYARLYDAKGETKKAAEYYRRAAEFASTHDGFDPEIIDDFLQRARELDASA